MSSADRHLLFGLLALQNGLIDQVQLVAAFQAWTRDKDQSLADHLVARGDLDAEDRAGVEAMVRLHVRKHGDVEKSLGFVPAGESTRQRLAALGDAELVESLTILPTIAPADDSYMTHVASVGTTTSDGLRFRVLRPHARGGLGAVFVALDDELHREVALKQIRDEYAGDPTNRQRFLLEAEITGGLEHPGIVPVYGLGSYTDGRPYYAMRFIRGDSLHDAIARFHRPEGSAAAPSDGPATPSAGTVRTTDPTNRSLELRKLLRRFLDVCNAIEYAHRAEFCTATSSPATSSSASMVETLVVDWARPSPGLAEPGRGPASRPLVPHSASGTAETLPGNALGTPAYMSPEQGRRPSISSALKATCIRLATLYALLTGRAPFQGQRRRATLRQVQQGEFPPPRQLDPEIDRPLESRLPEGRARCVRGPLRLVPRTGRRRRAAGWPTSRSQPTPSPSASRARRWMKRHRPAVTAAAGS
ncbi:MAG: serine/threonine-protein kinase [Isosphaeraceae bacterium]